MTELKKWRYCVAGNIINERVDEDGIARNGTVVFPPGRKVYLSKRLWRPPDEVTVMGLNRFKSKYVLERVPLVHIENIRCQKVFKPRVTELMCDDIEHHDMWWGSTGEDYLDAQMFVFAIQTISSSVNNPDAEWLFVSDDGTTLSLYPYAGKAWEVGRQIQSLYDDRPYMNGYCWSSIIKYYLKSINSIPLLENIEMFPREHVCAFNTQTSNREGIRRLLEILRNNIIQIPAWLIESRFDEWDDWG